MANYLNFEGLTNFKNKLFGYIDAEDDKKQDKLTEGANIKIENNVISVIDPEVEFVTEDEILELFGVEIGPKVSYLNKLDFSYGTLGASLQSFQIKEV